ncbi:ribosomal large subunit pseudouridine synthase B [[Leptolyngbya] sp. PCC 7376]|uniref:pseudouridine synthase n=1 Tax=[Leptolyngbya] sp. PCC 7376 TaxID=111781 RepID=UPI00029ECC18|nr:pseudouridine synthase [[Leptolyngbya] sp. PCC 7376]AFY37226.1 ribosomal large subunit pseudouridine synthase B [[Leptolyngbya] sp. PCC 7376]
MTERVQKILAHWGIASRRSAEKMIVAGRVTLNGEVVQLGDRADPAIDDLYVDGKKISPTQRPSSHYYLIHKPKGVVSTCYDPRDRPTVLTLLPEDLQQGQGMHPIGRLDAQSTGALLLTNDGDLTLALTHPRYHVSKRYRVWLKGIVPDSTLTTWRNGVILDGRKTLPAKITLKKINQGKTCVDIMLTEGRNRQIRRVAEQLGYPVISLHRSAIGSIKLGNLQRGHARPLTDSELRQLQTPTPTQASPKLPVSHREHSV